MRRDNHLVRNDPSSQEWVLGDFSTDPERSARISAREPASPLPHRRTSHSSTFSFAAALAFLFHLAVILILWQQLSFTTPATETVAFPVTEVELAPRLALPPTISQPAQTAPAELQDFQGAALARTEALEQTLTQAITQRSLTETTRQQQLASLTEAQTTLQGQVTSLAEEKAELSTRLESERQRAEALAQHVHEMQLAREQELQGIKGTYEHLVTALQSEISQKEIALHQAKEQLTVTILDRVLFPSGQATLSQKANTFWRKLAGFSRK